MRPKVLRFILLTVFAVPMATLNAAMTEKAILARFPSLTEEAQFWHEALIVIDAQIANSGLRVVCGRVGTLGAFCWLGLRVERNQKLVQTVYFTSKDYTNPILEEGNDEVRVVMSSGYVLLVVRKSPNQSAQPTRTTGG
jgi:hypothetical protein